jgi:manganese-transporting P-type ATPase
MSTISSLPSGRSIISVKGAPETLKSMILPSSLPAWYDDVYKGYTREGSRVLALGLKELREGEMSAGKIREIAREEVESRLVFVGFLVFSCPLKEDAVKAIKMLADSSHRVCLSGPFNHMRSTNHSFTVRYDHW